MKIEAEIVKKEIYNIDKKKIQVKVEKILEIDSVVVRFAL